MVTGFSTGGGLGQRPPSTTGKIDAQTAKQLEALRQPNTGQDVQSILNAQAQAAYQEPLPALDLEWTWSKPATKTTPAQRGFRYTWNTARAGLNMQRDLIEKAYNRVSDQTLVAHVADQAILPWEVVTQSNVRATPLQGNGSSIMWVMFKGRLVFTCRNTIGARVWFEQSDGTFAELTGLSIDTSAGIQNLTTLVINGNEKLVISALTNTIFLSDLSAASTEHSWAALSAGIIPFGMVQTPAPGGPMVVASGPTVYLVPTDYAHMPESLTAGQKCIVGYNSGTTLQKQILPRPFKLGGGQARCYFIYESTTGFFTRYIQSFDIYGVNRERLELSMQDILGADLGRRGLVVHNLDRVIFYDNKERDLQIFFNSKPFEGYTLLVNGIKWVDDQVFAEVCQLPAVFAVQGSASATANYLGYHALWRFDFAIGKWSQVTSWETWQGFTGDPQFREGNEVLGALSGTPVSQMAFSDYTRMFTFLAPDVAPNPYQPIHRFYQQPASVNPYSQMGLGRNVASTGRLRSAGLLFPQDTRNANKYIDEVYWSGEASGGAGSQLDFYWGEYGHLDDVDSSGRRKAMHAEFKDGLNHESRHWSFNVNNSAVMVPQLEMVMTRGVSDQSMQGFTFTILGHVDIPDYKYTPPNTTTGRSQV